MRRAFAAVLALWGCSDEGLLAEGTPSRRVDAGFFRVDSGTASDAGPRPDARPVDPPDAAAGSPDAEPEPSCVCPTLPASCPALSPNVPAFSPGPSLAEQVFGVIACADHELDIAMYETDWDCVVTALAAKLAADPDVQIRMVIDDDQCPLDPGGTRLCALARLHGEPRVTIIDDARSRYMHHKFAIADGAVLWMGSSNFTRVSLCSELNDGLVIDEPATVAAYAAEWERLFVSRSFGPKAPVPPAGGGPYKVYFAPESPLTSPSAWFIDMIAAVDTATRSVSVMTAAWTRTELSDALIRASRRGVSVRALVPVAYQDEPPAQALVSEGLPVRLARVHHKLMIVDERLVITGSPNWSENSWANNEASLWIADPAIAREYVARFEASFGAGRVP